MRMERVRISKRGLVECSVVQAWQSIKCSVMLLNSQSDLAQVVLASCFPRSFTYALQRGKGHRNQNGQN